MRSQPTWQLAQTHVTITSSISNRQTLRQGPHRTVATSWHHWSVNRRQLRTATLPCSCSCQPRAQQSTKQQAAATIASSCDPAVAGTCQTSSSAPTNAAAAAAAAEDQLPWWPSHAAELQHLQHVVLQLLSQLDSLQPGEAHQLLMHPGCVGGPSTSQPSTARPSLTASPARQ